MNADKLFDKYAKEMTPEGNGYYLNRDAFIAALSEAMCCGHLQPVVSQPGEAGSKGGPQNAELKVFLLRKMEEYNYTFRNTDDEDRRYKAFISYKALEKFLKDAKKANFIK